jgi:xanthine dehydrogenase accessory factor
MFDEYFRTAHELTRAGRPFATATVVRAERPTSGKPGDRAIITADGTLVGWIGGSCAQPTVIREAVAALAEDKSRLIRLSPEPGTRPAPEGITEVAMTCFSGGTLDIFIEPHHPRPRLLLVGSLPVAQALAHLGHALNYHVIAVDPTGSDAMAHADEVVRTTDEIAARITPLTFVVVATHGDFDEPALIRILATESPYVGLVASRKRGQAVVDSLAAQGVPADKLNRVRYPAGLDIFARRGDEIALGIMAEIVKTRRSLERLATAMPVMQTAGNAAGETAIDPVCNMTVHVAGAQHMFEHDGRTFYFCCGGCRTRFAKDPSKFLAPAS